MLFVSGHGLSLAQMAPPVDGGIFILTREDISTIVDVMSTSDQLLREIEEFMAATGLKEWQVGKGAVNDAMFVSRLRSGAQPRTDTLDRVREFMKKRRNAVAAA